MFVGGDVDNNGLIDFVFGSDQKAVLLQQNARGYIEYPLTGNLVSQRSNLVDVNGDGDLDLFVCNDEGENFIMKMMVPAISPKAPPCQT
ncbi:MAG: VCBS repeat-containing protein [Saprospiraceae bacterium]|nr:VCBS repeat-containing protein [Saprospiraceae bacterium]